MEKTIKAWMGFSDGKPYLSYNGMDGRDATEYCIYKVRKIAKEDFDDVRPCKVTFED